MCAKGYGNEYGEIQWKGSGGMKEDVEKIKSNLDKASGYADGRREAEEERNNADETDDADMPER